MELKDTLEMTRRIPCRNGVERKLQNLIEEGVGELIPLREWLAAFWNEFKSSGATSLSAKEYSDVNRKTRQGEELAKALREVVQARVVLSSLRGHIDG
ncbi:hypothetical protein ASG42_24485 [Rhizobium sp. Leaf391]|uniref:hypothetical protein n=1 Tax=Rhizobium sp. Leaf391 TaxID=1736360 RepID=UPI000715F09A|nr:hypothetical protein [Rhizobium sp. Leaf391]KQT03172.1 hypothetical protein ASG42_24485 [Rhizobium sp. Leaf391]